MSAKVLVTVVYHTPKLIDPDVETALAAALSAPPWNGTPEGDSFDQHANERSVSWAVDCQNLNDPQLRGMIGLVLNKARPFIVDWHVKMEL